MPRKNKPFEEVMEDFNNSMLLNPDTPTLTPIQRVQSNIQSPITMTSSTVSEDIEFIADELVELKSIVKENTDKLKENTEKILDFEILIKSFNLDSVIPDVGSKMMKKNIKTKKKIISKKQTKRKHHKNKTNHKKKSKGKTKRR